MTDTIAGLNVQTSFITDTMSNPNIQFLSPTTGDPITSADVKQLILNSTLTSASGLTSNLPLFEYTYNLTGVSFDPNSSFGAMAQNFAASAVPEPSSGVLFLVGVLVASWRVLRKRRHVTGDDQGGGRNGLHGVREGPFPRFDATMRRSDSPPSFSLRFGAFAGRYHRFALICSHRPGRPTGGSWELVFRFPSRICRWRRTGLPSSWGTLMSHVRALRPRQDRHVLWDQVATHA